MSIQELAFYRVTSFFHLWVGLTYSEVRQIRVPRVVSSVVGDCGSVFHSGIRKLKNIDKIIKPSPSKCPTAIQPFFFFLSQGCFLNSFFFLKTKFGMNLISCLYSSEYYQQNCSRVFFLSLRPNVRLFGGSYGRSNVGF